MVSYIKVATDYINYVIVLILVVVEDGLGPRQPRTKRWSSYVLILVVVEDGLVPAEDALRIASKFVLILVVVEDGLVLMHVVYLTPNFLQVLILVVVEDGLVQMRIIAVVLKIHGS